MPAVLVLALPLPNAAIIFCALYTAGNGHGVAE